MDIKELKKLKVGDKVKIVDEQVGACLFVGRKKWLGEIMTIRNIDSFGSEKFLMMCEDADDRYGIGWCWYPHMIDCKVDEIDCKVDELVTIENHIICGNKTIVRLSNGKVGIARCNPQDAFDVYEGQCIAAARAYGKEPLIK